MDNGAEDRDKLKFWMLNDHLDLPNVKTCEIITFNTIALKGAIRDIGRGLNMPLDEVDKIAKAVHEVSVDEEKIVTIDDSWRKQYPELFKYVDIVIGTIVSIGSHPSGVVVSDLDISSEFGLCYLKDDPYPVSCINMKELDSLNFTKQDALGLDNIGIINDTCKLAGIDRLSPKTIDFEDDAVWDSIRNDTSLIFQMNSNYGQRTVEKMLSKEVYDKIKKQIPNMTRLDLLTFINALIRPCGKGVYNDATNGIVFKTGIKDIDNLLGPSMGYAIMQEPQMAFVQKFCGYDFLRADKLRKIIGKKLGTREQLPIIKEGWDKNAKVRYNLTDEESDKIINPFLQCILDATRYSFSLVHSLSYSCISYECAYLRYYYPLQYITSCLNVWNGDDDKTAEAIDYATSIKIKILSPKFRYAKAAYFYNEETNSIYKGTSSIKGLNAGYSDYLYSLKDKKYDSFVELLYDIQSSGMPRDQIETLIKLDYFEEFGTSKELALIFNSFQFFKKGEAKTISKDKLSDSILYSIVKRNANETEKQFNKLNCRNILHEVEQYIKSLNVGDVDMKTKIANQIELMGYIGIRTNKSEDRPKVVVLDMKVMKKQGDLEPWGVSIEAQSIGSGKRSSYTVPYRVYKKDKFNKSDIIKITNWYRNNRGYFYITSYEQIIA